MATYNGAKYLSEQITSIIDQLLPGDEFLIADDGSYDSTVAIALSFGATTRLIASTRSGGVVANFSRVMEAASGDLIVLADQDDVWLPGRLSAIRQALQEVDLVMLDARIVDENLIDLGSTLFEILRPSQSLLRNVWKNGFVGCCMGFRRSLLLRASPIPRWIPWHDWYIGCLACMVGRVRLIPKSYLLYRRHGDNVSDTGQRSRTSALEKASMRLRLVFALVLSTVPPHWRGSASQALINR